MEGTFGTGLYDNTMMVGLGQPGMWNDHAMRLVFEENRSNDFNDRFRRLELKVRIIDQRIGIFGGGGY